MGSLTSRPKTPSRPQVVYTPAPVTNPSAPAPQPSTPAASTAGTDTETGAKTRAASLLLRDRGVFGTILTGFRGLLNPAAATPRKTLLGE